MNALPARCAVALLALAATCAHAAPPLPPPVTPAPVAVQAPAWAPALQRRLDAADARFPGDIGVWVHHIGRDESFSYRADEPWYLASGVKVPVAIAVMREVERRRLSLSSRVTLLDTDFVDGAGHTNALAAGSRARVSWLLEQMIVYSDNTASDVLIRTVGLDRVNAVAAELIAAEGVQITSLADVRRRAYGMFHAGAEQLTSADLLALQRAGAGGARVRKLAQLLAVQQGDLAYADLTSGFEAYYATHVNTASLADYGHMLTALSEGRALGAEGTRYLLDVMARVETGKQRIRAGLPEVARFAHKTGTQYRRVCDLGIVTVPVQGRDERIVVTACARGGTASASERALRDVATALTGAGVFRLSTPLPTAPP